MREEQDEQAREIEIRDALEATRRGAELTRKLLSFARRADLRPTVLDLNRIVSQTRDWSERVLPANIRIETSLTAGLWPVEADRASTENAILNLILNARDAMPRGGTMTIETANMRISREYIEERHESFEPGRYVMLAISDTGEGIPPELLDKVIEPFFSTKANGSGSGLGLSMVDGFMRQSGGYVRIYSEPGVGTTVKLYFRAARAELKAEEPAEARRVEPTQKGLTVLVAEDEPKVMEVVTRMLTRAGYGVLQAESGDRALELFRQHRDEIDIVLTDIVMPGELQGPMLAREIRALGFEPPVIFMSGYPLEATVHGNGLRPDDIRLMKPVSRADLMAALDAVASHKTRPDRGPEAG